MLCNNHDPTFAQLFPLREQWFCRKNFALDVNLCQNFKLIALLSFIQSDISVLTYSYNSQHFLLLFSLGFYSPQGISFLADFVRKVLVIVRKVTGHRVSTYHVGGQL